MCNEPEELTPEIRATMEAHTRDLLQLCEQAIAGQKRIIAHDGALTAHRLSLESLEQQKAILEQELAEIQEAPTQ